ncbi:MAG: hypothetical protein ACKPJF_26100 [Dolichospermum sp.]
MQPTVLVGNIYDVQVDMCPVLLSAYVSPAICVLAVGYVAISTSSKKYHLLIAVSAAIFFVKGEINR